MNREGEKERGIETCMSSASLTNSLIPFRPREQVEELEANGENIGKDSVSICPSEGECNGN